jgi:NTP pyrophosphatase (non-canonical NTP hydrolase)
MTVLDVDLWDAWTAEVRASAEMETTMNADTYQDLAARTLIDRPGFELTDNEVMLIWNATGLAGEAGEVNDLIKKGIFHQHGLDRDKLIKELGDVLWYVAALATRLDASLGDIMQANVDKLKARYPAGYSSEASLARVDTAS